MYRSVTLLLLLWAGSALAQSTVFVQSRAANITESPNFGATVKAELVRGQQLEVLSTEGAWYRVRWDGHEGWIPKLLVAGHVPMQRATVVTGEEISVKDSARRRASNMTTAGAARGLAGEDRRRTSQDNAADYEAVLEMESYSLEESDVDSFAKVLEK